MQVFICHSSKDQECVKKLSTNLEIYYSLNVFSSDELKGGEGYPLQLITAIKKYDMFVVLLSKNFHNAEFTEQEVGIALAQNKPVLPLTIDGTIPFGYIKTTQAVTVDSNFDSLPNMLKISTAIYDLFYINKSEKINAIISNLEKAYSYSNKNSLARMLEVDGEYAEHQLLKLKRVLDNGELEETRVAKDRIKAILELNPIREDVQYDPDNDPGLYGH